MVVDANVRKFKHRGSGEFRMPVIDESDKYRAPALDKGLDILELLSSAEEGLSQVEIAKALSRSANEIYRMLDRLVRRNYVRRTPADRYEITLKLFELAHARPPLNRLTSLAVPVMRRFARNSWQACHLGVHDRDSIVVVAQVDGAGAWHVSLRVGSRLPMTGSAAGHIYLAHLSAEERGLLLAPRSSRRQHAAGPDLEQRLAAIHERGYECVPSSDVVGLTNISAPIRGPLDGVIATLTCPFMQRLNPEAPGVDDVIAMVVDAAAELSRGDLSRPGE